MHAPILGSLSRPWPDEAACAADAARLAACPAVADALIELDGPLGAGKTSFTRHLLRALGVGGRIKSPSYAVVEPHAWTDAQGQPRAAWHFDFYRFGDPREWEDAGLRELFGGPGLKLVEWPQQAGPDRPTADLRLLLQVLPAADGSEPRSVQAQALSPRGLQLLQALDPDRPG